jgi:ribosome-associated protein
MRSSPEAAPRLAPHSEPVSPETDAARTVDQIVRWLDDAKAEDIVTIDIKGKSSIGDFMVIASGRTDRHVGAIADQIQTKLKELERGRVRLEGQQQCDWVLIDAGDIIVHVFRPEVREFYNLEKMWQSDWPADTTAH